MLCSHHFKDTVVSHSVSEDHNPLLRAAARCPPHGQKHRVRPGTKPQHTGAVWPHTPHTGNGADYSAWKTDDESRRRTQNKRVQRVWLAWGEFNQEPPLWIWKALLWVIMYSYCCITGMLCLHWQVLKLNLYSFTTARVIQHMAADYYGNISALTEFSTCSSCYIVMAAVMFWYMTFNHTQKNKPCSL